MSESSTLTLAVDSGSPVVSIAVGCGRRVLGETSYRGGPESPSLLQEIDNLLESAKVRMAEIEQVIGAGGPGSFTGLRNGLATLLGLHQALDVSATAVSSFLPLSAQAPELDTVVAAVDALRGEWFVQVFDPTSRRTLCEPRIVRPSEITRWSPCTIVAFGVDGLREVLEEAPDVELKEASPLAPSLLDIACSHALVWDPAPLVSPLYLRPPAARRSL